MSRDKGKSGMERFEDWLTLAGLALVAWCLGNVLFNAWQLWSMGWRP